MKWFKHGVLAMIIAAFIAIDVQADTLRSDLVTNTNAVPPDMNNPNVDGGVIRRKRATYTFTGSEATGDVVEMVTMPYGSIILREQSTIRWGNMGGTVTVEVGDTFDPDRYCTSLTMGTPSISTESQATNTTFLESIGNNGTYTHNIVGTSTGDDTVDLTLTTVTTPTTGTVIVVEVVYVSTG